MSSIDKRTQDKIDLLKQPLHGIYIPTALMLVGTAIIDYTYLPYILAFLAVLFTYRIYGAYNRRQSLDPEKWRSLELIDSTVISRNSAIYSFELVRPTESLDIPVGHHVAVKMDNDIRYYTPISSKSEQGYFDILVKSYANGNVSRQFASLKPGQTVKFRGPVGRFSYTANEVEEIGMVCGGSGITPILQVISEITTTPDDLTKISLIYANETENDILLKSELDELAQKYPNFSVAYTLTFPPDNWTGEVGYVTKEMCDKYLPSADANSRILVCGPPGMKTDMINFTEQLGFPKAEMPSKGQDRVFIF